MRYLTSPMRGRMSAGLVIFLFWTVFGVLSAGQIYIRESADGLGTTVRSVFNIVYFYWAWALVTPLALRIARDVMESARPWWHRVVLNLPLAMTILGLQAICYALFSVLDERAAVTAFPAKVLGVFVRHLAGNVLTGIVIVVAYCGYLYYRRAQEGALRAAEVALRASEVETLLVRMRLDALKTQLQPHFLFNTLNMISGLIAKEDAVTANRAIARLGELLRIALSSSADQEISLREELEFTRQYLEIAKLRFGDRLTITEQIDEAALVVKVPTLVLQPLVENAIRHGISERPGAGRIAISARCADGCLTIRIVDDGPGFAAPAPTEGVGVGLANVRARLAQLYGTGASLELQNASGGGASVTLRRQLHWSGAEDPDRRLVPVAAPG